MILTSTQARIDGYEITAYKGTVQGKTWGELLRNTEKIGANAVLNVCYDNALDVDTQFHGVGVVLLPIKSLLRPHQNSLTNDKSQILRSEL